MAEHAKKKAIAPAMQLSTGTDRTKRHFLLLQEDEHDQNAGLAMLPLVVKAALLYIKYHNAGLTELIDHACKGAGCGSYVYPGLSRRNMS